MTLVPTRPSFRAAAPSRDAARDAARLPNPAEAPAPVDPMARAQQVLTGAAAANVAKGQAAQGLLGATRTTNQAPPLPGGTSTPADLYSDLAGAAEGATAPDMAMLGRPQGAGAAAASRFPESGEPLATKLDKALPQTATSTPTGRERILERARGFEQQTAEMAKNQTDPQSPLGRLRGGLGDGFAKDAPIELHGVASHFSPEAMQARVKDKAGKESTFVQDSAGAWVSRPDLQTKHAAGRIPSADPGMTTGAKPSATFGIATVGADGKVSLRLPTDIQNFSHEPRARPFGVGDSVQVVEATGEAKVSTAGQRLVEDDRVIFGKITGHDGKGNWKVDLPKPAPATTGAATSDAAATPAPTTETRTITDRALREANNPTILRDGTRVYDASFNGADAAQKRLVGGFRETDAAKALQASRPGPGATAAERAAWERQAIDAADSYLDDKMKYPMSQESIALVEQPLLDKRAELKTLDATIAERSAAAGRGASYGAPLPADVAALVNQRQALAGEIDTMKASLDKELAGPKKYWELTNGAPNIGEYADIGLGQCRHQALGMQVLLQDLGVDARMTRGAANTSEGNYRGEHMWIEVTLSDGSHLLVDPTWSRNGEQPGALDRTYGDDKRRIEDPGSTVEDYRKHLTSVPARDGKRIDIDDERVLLA